MFSVESPVEWVVELPVERPVVWLTSKLSTFLLASAKWSRESRAGVEFFKHYLHKFCTI